MLRASALDRISGTSATGCVTACTIGAFLLGYLLLERKMLPRQWWPALAKFYFTPMMVPNLLFRIAQGKPYFTEVDSVVMLGAVPMVVAGHLSSLHDAGVRAVVNLQAEYPGPVASYAAMHPPIEQLWLPVVDHTEPSVEVLRSAVLFIAKYRALGHRVLVHCKGGHGRSAAVAMAWLIRAHELTPQAAQRRLSSMRHVRKALYQQAAVLQFYEGEQTSKAKL